MLIKPEKRVQKHKEKNKIVIEDDEEVLQDSENEPFKR